MIGTILGQAFDRAVTIMLDKWLVFLCAYVVLAAAYLQPNPASLILTSVVSLIWYPISAALAIKAFRPGFAASAGDAAHLIMAAIAWSLATIAPSSILAALMIPNYLHARQVGESSMMSSIALVTALAGALIYALWMGSKLSLAPTLTFVEHQTVDAAFKRSWNLTAGRFWPVIGFNVLITIAQQVLAIVPIAIAAALVAVTFKHPVAGQTPEYIGSHVVPALLSPLVLYATLASWCGYVRLLDWLESLEQRPAVA